MSSILTIPRLGSSAQPPLFPVSDGPVRPEGAEGPVFSEINAEKIRKLREENEERLKNYVEEIKQQISDSLESIIYSQLNKSPGEGKSDLLQNISLTGVNGGAGGVYFSSLSNGELQLTAFINDSIKGSEGNNIFVGSSLSVSIEIDDEMRQKMKEAVLEYIGSGLEQVKKLQPGESIVLEETGNGIPLISASRDNDGIKIKINKNGISLNIVLKPNELDIDGRAREEK